MKNKIEIFCCDNGVMVSIKKGKEIISSKVFEGSPEESIEKAKTYLKSFE